jgi:site-specific DNA-methyltransferase (adenine-specific)
MEMTGRKEESAGLLMNRPDGTIRENPFAGKSGEARNNHPTVKPTNLMRYLCRLVTPPKGIIIDPFCGSGSTGKAAALEGFRFIGIDKEIESVRLAQARININPLFRGIA